jgi:hypothetical protein
VIERIGSLIIYFNEYQNHSTTNKDDEAEEEDILKLVV